jgi:hypothetical protein
MHLHADPPVSSSAPCGRATDETLPERCSLRDEARSSITRMPDLSWAPVDDRTARMLLPFQNGTV